MRKVKGRSVFLSVLTAFLVFIFIFIFGSKSYYNTFKSFIVKDSKKYIEMHAYAKTKPGQDKYFIIQDNEEAKSFLGEDVRFVKESELESLSLEKDTVFLYEKGAETIEKFLKEKKGTEISLNKGTEIEFLVGAVEREKIPGTKNSSCR